VLLGDPEIWEWVWTRWQRAQGTTVAVGREPGRDAALRTWLCDGRAQVALRDNILTRAAERLELSREELCARHAAHARSQLEQFVEQLDRATSLGPALLHATLGQDALALPELVCGDFPCGVRLVAPALGAQLPALLLSPTAPDANWLSEACSTLIALAETLPRAELALATTETQFSAWLSRARPRDVAILHAGMLRLATQADGAALSQASLVTYDEDEFARSRAESTLYRRLEQRPRTHGLFELNTRLPARFGSAHLEVDLLCEDLRIAVEIDGYHHFRDEAAYRRDRCKDVILQGLGYLVVRVLASDVMSELDFVIGTIDQVVERQRKGSVA